MMDTYLGDKPNELTLFISYFLFRSFFACYQESKNSVLFLIMKPYLTFYIDMIMTTDRKSEFCTIVSDQSNYDQIVEGIT